MVNFGPSLGHPCKVQRVSHLGSVNARHSSNGRQSNFTALNRGRHQYSAGRPSRLALAHISSLPFYCSWRRTWSSTRTISFVVCLVAVEVINAWRKIVVYFHIWHVAKVPRHLNSSAAVMMRRWVDLCRTRSCWKCRVVVFFVVIGGFNGFCSRVLCRCMKWNRFCIHLYSTRHHGLTVHSP